MKNKFFIPVLLLLVLMLFASFTVKDTLCTDSSSAEKCAGVEKSFPKGRLVYFYFSHKGSMRPGGPEYTVKRTDDGQYKVTFINDEGKEPIKRERLCSEKVGDDLREIFRKGKVHRYKMRYINKHVLDGSSWKFNVKFDDGTSICSYGYMDGPRDRSGINNAIAYLDELLNKGNE